MSELRWDVVTATARGSSHTDDVGNQDRVLHRHVATGDGDVVIVALADGHGSARHMRSALGAEYAVGTAVELAAERVRTASAGTTLIELVTALPGPVVSAWRERCLEHWRSAPFTAGERAGLEIDPDRDPPIAYGATLLLAVARGPEIAIAQLGDGDVLARVDDGAADRPVPGDSRLVANVTTSLCLAGAEGDFRFAGYGPERDCTLLVLASDGYGNAFASQDWHTAVVHDLADIVHELGPHAVGERLPGWLQESAAIGGDDVTVALLSRDRAGEAAASPAPSPTAVGSTPIPTRRSRAVLIGALATLGAVAVAGGTAWALKANDPVAPGTGSTQTSPSAPAPSDTDGASRASPAPAPSESLQPRNPSATPKPGKGGKNESAAPGKDDGKKPSKPPPRATESPPDATTPVRASGRPDPST